MNLLRGPVNQRNNGKHSPDQYTMNIPGLPCERTLQYYGAVSYTTDRIGRLRDGVQRTVLAFQQALQRGMHIPYFVLACDEMDIREGLVYNKTTGKPA